MRRIFAQARKELTQLLRDRLAVALALLLPVILLLLQTTAISLTVKDLPIIVQDLDQSQASQKLVDAFRQSLSFHVASWPTDKQPEEAFASNKARGALIIPEEYGRQHRARRRRHGADSGRCFGREYRANHFGRCGANRSRVQRGKRGSDAPTARHRRDPVVVQPEPLVAEILRARNLRAGHVPFSAAAGDAGHVQGRRAENDSAGLRLEHFRA